MYRQRANALYPRPQGPHAPCLTHVNYTETQNNTINKTNSKLMTNITSFTHWVSSGGYRQVLI